LAKAALFFFGIALWYNGLTFYSYYLLVFAWVLDGGLGRFGEIIKEPLVLAVLILCITVALGLLWSEQPAAGMKVWRRYFAFLVFIPFLSLLNKKRLPWAIAGLCIGYFGILLITISQWMITGVNGIPLLNLPYTSFAAVLGIGIILTVYLASINNSKKLKLLLWFFAIFLLYVQFDQGARGSLLATLFTLMLMLLIQDKARSRTFFTFIVLLAIGGFLAYSSDNFQQRLIQAKSDIDLTREQKFDSSLGYRLALWDVGLHGIVERPIHGHGTGMAASYFDKTVETYKNGIYKDLHKFATTYHYHNDWIEIGMQLGLVGVAAYAFLLWGWFQTLRIHKRTILGASLVCFFFLSGLTDTLVFYRRTFYLLLVVTAIAVGWQNAYGTASLPEENVTRGKRRI
jgi:O-antigen ligase